MQVSLERALTDVRLEQGNAVTLAQIRQIIRNGGFNAGSAEIEVVGRLTVRDGQTVLKVVGTSEEFRLLEDTAHPAASAEARTYAGKGDASLYVVIGKVEKGQELSVRSVRNQ